MYLPRRDSFFVSPPMHISICLLIPECPTCLPHIGQVTTIYIIQRYIICHQIKHNKKLNTLHPIRNQCSLRSISRLSALGHYITVSLLEATGHMLIDLAIFWKRGNWEDMDMAYDQGIQHGRQSSSQAYLQAKIQSDYWCVGTVTFELNNRKPQGYTMVRCKECGNRHRHKDVDITFDSS